MRADAPTPKQLATAAMTAERARVAVPPRGCVQVPLRVSQVANELPRLVNTSTGECMGIAASTAVAERTKEFFA